MDINNVAHLARLALSPEEAERFQDQIDQILKHVEQLESVDVSGIEPTAHANPVYDVIREDKALDHSFTAEEALANAPETSMEQFKMGVKVVE